MALVRLIKTSRRPECITQIRERTGILRLERCAVLQAGDTCIELPQGPQSHPAIDLSQRKIRVGVKDLLIEANGFCGVTSPLTRQRTAKGSLAVYFL